MTERYGASGSIKYYTEPGLEGPKARLKSEVCDEFNQRLPYSLTSQ
jgi:hypothetical protein